jgi:hypothetical protein
MSEKDVDVYSVDQDAWIEIARRGRTELEKQIPLMGAMKPEELKTFIGALTDTRWLNEKALVFDKDVDDALAKLPYGN